MFLIGYGILRDQNPPDDRGDFVHAGLTYPVGFGYTKIFENGWPAVIIRLISHARYHVKMNKLVSCCFGKLCYVLVQPTTSLSAIDTRRSSSPRSTASAELISSIAAI